MLVFRGGNAWSVPSVCSEIQMGEIDFLHFNWKCHQIVHPTLSFFLWRKLIWHNYHRLFSLGWCIWQDIWFEGHWMWTDVLSPQDVGLLASGDCNMTACCWAVWHELPDIDLEKLQNTFGKHNMYYWTNCYTWRHVSGILGDNTFNMTNLFSGFRRFW